MSSPVFSIEDIDLAEDIPGDGAPIAMLSARSIVVAGEASLRVVDSSGRQARRFGRSGGGPGEFIAIAAVGAAEPDSVWVFDRAARRFSMLSRSAATGELRYVRSAALPVSISGFVPAVVRRCADGTLLVFADWLPPPSGGMSGRVVDSSRVYRALGDSAAMVIAKVPVRTSIHGGDHMSFKVPLSPRAHVVAAPDGIFFGFSETYRIERIGCDGSRRTVLQEQRARLTLDAAAVPAAIEKELATMPPDFRPAAARLFNEYPPPSMLPAFGAMAGSSDGGFWVEQAAPLMASNIEWRMYDSAGVQTGAAMIRAGVQVRAERGGRIVATSEDDDGTRALHVYRLIRMGASSPGSEPAD